MEYLRKLRKAKGLTQKQLGEMCGVSESSINRLETGIRKPGHDLLMKLSQALDCSVDYLVTGKSTLIVSKDDPWFPDDPDVEIFYDAEGNPVEIKKPSELTEGELKQRAREEKLLEAFRQLPPEIQEVVLAQTRGVLQTRKDPDSL